MLHLRTYAAAIATGAAFLLATGCSTPTSRINEHAKDFQGLPPAEQALVRDGEIRTGFDKDAVFLAWGRPDNIRPGMTQGKPSETWSYIGYRQDTIQHFDVIPHPVPGKRGVFAPEPITTPVYENHPYIRRQVLLENGKVVAWSEGQLP